MHGHDKKMQFRWQRWMNFDLIFFACCSELLVQQTHIFFLLLLIRYIKFILNSFISILWHHAAVVAVFYCCIAINFHFKLINFFSKDKQKNALNLINLLCGHFFTDRTFNNNIKMDEEEIRNKDKHFVALEKKRKV